jgi:sulfhydrogenase subunit beta (sulfur reductase)
MTETPLSTGITVAIKKDAINTLIQSLQRRGYQTVGPVLQDEVICYRSINGLVDLPFGIVTEQEKGSFRLKRDQHKRYFSHTPGADSWKKYLFPPISQLFEAHRENGDWRETITQEKPPKYAFIGVRPCELAAIDIQDRVFIREDFTDPIYLARRANILTIVVNCDRPSRTCFCTSMGTGPKAHSGFDLSLTELDEVFLVEIGSDAGRAVMDEVDQEPASAYWLQIAEKEMQAAEAAIVRQIQDTPGVPDRLMNNLEHPHWREVGKRCLSCTSCTQVCPTCFCWDVIDQTNFSGDHTRRVRLWDSCFNPAYTAVAGGNPRPTTTARYRQWLIHKMATWHQQFGSSGCVGCGRCITWCPAEIDITEEVNSFLEVPA